MEVIKGTAKKVRNTVKISGKGSSVSTTHISLFQIEGQPVKVKSNEPLMIENHDLICVAGNKNKGLFNAYAYKNLTTGVSGNENITLIFIFGLILLFVGVSVFAKFSVPFFGFMPKILSLVFVFSGLYSFYMGNQVLKASKLLILEEIS
ncbi:hypothetical protein [Moritella dasanensis]|uniref:hypothetical protein n=1 Tax=Moritella dasanensis TaxID=428031 RepID=UPI00037A39C9|nr:hypothetical protein [Moritella dasanensis]